MAKQLVRTCRNDGIQWHVPRHLRRVPNRAQVAGRKMQASGEKYTASSGWGRGANVAYRGVLDDVQQATQLQHCPYCGAKNWTEIKARHMPPALEAQIARIQGQLALQWPVMAPPPPPPPMPPPPPTMAAWRPAMAPPPPPPRGW